MHQRSLAVLAAMVAVCSIPAAAGELRPEEAGRFVAGKLFSYACFDGTSGAGRISADGSVTGTIQIRGRGPTRFVALPSGTIRVKPAAICASVRGMPFEPCFKVVQTSSRSFRGSISGLGFAYCDFAHRNPRRELAAPMASPRLIQPAAMVTSAGK